MDEASFYAWLLRAWFGLAAEVFVALLAVQAVCGRFRRLAGEFGRNELVKTFFEF
jgi:hypothetical protein